MIRPTWAVLAMALVLPACATTTMQLAPITPEEVAVEEQKQRELALQMQEAQQRRLDSISFPILQQAVSLCGEEIRGYAGFRFASIHSYETKWQPAARQVFGLSDTVSVLAVQPSGPAAGAGLRDGDQILAANGVTATPGKASTEALAEVLERVNDGSMRQLTLDVLRDGQPTRVIIPLATVCRYPAIVVDDGALNAWADGNAIFVTSSMMRFAEDPELRVVIGHELAHNAMGHIKAKKQNAFLGALVGALGDAAMASMGVNSGGYYTAQGMQAGAISFSQDFEREADYVGLYALALAGFDLTDAPMFWRQMAQANPKSIGLAFTHPTTAERFVRMEKAIAEIEAKQASGAPLEPERKP